MQVVSCIGVKMAGKLKRLGYVSRSVADDKASVPAELPRIVIQSRRFNHAHGITGFLTWRNGYYFQALEGESLAVESLFEKIRQDNRHDQIAVVWSENGVQERIFSGWRLKLWSASLTCSEVNRYIRLYADRFDSLDERVRHRLSNIFDLDLIFSSEPGDLPDRGAISNYEFRLQALPGVFGLTDEHPYCIDVLTSLLAGWTSPARLSEQFNLNLDELFDLLSRNEVNSLLLKRSAQSDRGGKGGGKEMGIKGHLDGVTHHRSFYDRLRSVFMGSHQ